MIAMADHFRLPEGFGPSVKARRRKVRPRRDHLIRALWALLDGETLNALTGVEKSVLLCVAAWADWGTGRVRLTRSSLEKHTGHTERACRRAVAELVRWGILTVAEEGSDGRGNATVYVIEKQGRSGPKTGVYRTVNRGLQTPTNRDDPRDHPSGSADAAPPEGADASFGGAR